MAGGTRAAKSVHERFAAWLEWTELSQEAMGLRLKISQVAVSKIARGETQLPNAVVLERIEEISADWPEGPITQSEWTAFANAPAGSAAR